MKYHAMLFVETADKFPHLVTEDALHWSSFRSHDMDRESARSQRRRHLKPDEAGSEHDHAPRPFDSSNHGAAIVERAQREDVRCLCAWNRRSHRLGPRSEEKAVERNCSSARETDLARGNVQTLCPHAKSKVDGVLGVKFLRAQGKPIFRRMACEIILGQIGSVDGRGFVVAQHDDVPAIIPSSQHFRRGESGSAPADNNDSLRAVGFRSGRRSRMRAFLNDEDFIIPLLDPPGVNRGERWSVQRLSRAETEAGVMPGAPHRLVDDETFGRGPL